MRRYLSGLMLSALAMSMGLLYVGTQALLLYQSQEAHDRKIKTSFRAADGMSERVAVEPVALVAQPHLRYALIPGGVQSGEEWFERIENDPVLRAWLGRNSVPCYGQATMQPAFEDFYVWSTYRKGDHIGWATRPTRIRKGEMILTLCGKTKVRAQCGNVIGLVPSQTSEDVEPAALEQPETTAAPMLLSTSAPEVFPALPPTRAADATTVSSETHSKKKLWGLLIPVVAAPLLWGDHDRKPEKPLFNCEPVERQCP